MAGLFSSGEQDMLGNIVQQRQQANQALGQNYGKYSGIVQAGAGMADIGADAMFGGKTGAADPRMQQMNEVKNIFSQVAMEVGNTTSAAFYNKLAQAWSAKFPEQAAKAAEKAAEVTKAESDAANETKNVYETIITKDAWGVNDIEKQVMITYKKDKDGNWVRWGAPKPLPENSRGKDFNDPRLNGGEQKKPRGEVEIGAAIKDEIGATIKLPPLKDQGGNLVGGDDPYSLPSPDEKPMQFPKKEEVKKHVDARTFLLKERQRLQKQGKSTAQVDKALQANQAKLLEIQAKLERK
jgi:hypothetical protein